MPKKEEGFFQVTWKEIVAGVLSLLILGAVSFVFSSFNNRLEAVEAQSSTNKELVSTINTLMTSELRLSISNLTNQLEKTGGDLNTFSNNQRSLERSVDRLEVIVEGIK